MSSFTSTPPKDAAALQIDECSFDNGLIADKVGVLAWNDDLNAVPVPQLATLGRQHGFSVIYVFSPTPVPSLQHCFQGQLIELEGDYDAVWEKLANIPEKFSTRQVTSGDWDTIAALYRHTFPTRFSRDPRIGEDRARRHKQICLQEYHKRNSDYFLVAATSSGTVIGFYSCLARDGDFFLYESVILPECRIGLAAAQLLKDNLQRLRQRQPTVKKLVTRIYADNKVSLDFYRKLGMNQSKEEYCYHLWT